MSIGLRLWILAAATSTVVASSVALAESDPDSAIQYRKAVMGAVGGNMKGAALIIQGKVDFNDNLAGHAQAISEAAKIAPAAFKQNTDGEGREKTTAKGEVWSKWSDFEAGLKKLQEEAAKLAQVAGSGDMAAAGAQLGALGKTCKGCHDNFRDK